MQPGPATERLEPSLRGHKQGAGSAPAAPAPHPQGRPRRCPRPGPNSEQQQVFLRRLSRRRGWGPGLLGSAAGDRRRTHRAPAGGPRQVLASPGRKTLLPLPPPPLPGESARSRRCYRRRYRRRARGARGARAPHRSLRASTYRAVRGRRTRGRGARPEPSNRLTREYRSQSCGQLCAGPTGSPRDACFCLRRPPRSAPHPRAGPAPVRAALLIGPPRPRLKRHAPCWDPRPSASQVRPRDTPRPGRVAPSKPDVEWGRGAPPNPRVLDVCLRHSQPTRDGEFRELARLQLPSH